jgi:hypothetical protein
MQAIRLKLKILGKKTSIKIPGADTASFKNAIKKEKKIISTKLIQVLKKKLE